MIVRMDEDSAAEEAQKRLDHQDYLEQMQENSERQLREWRSRPLEMPEGWVPAPQLSYWRSWQLTFGALALYQLANSGLTAETAIITLGGWLPLSFLGAFPVGMLGDWLLQHR